jgi:hypothetical protein
MIDVGFRVNGREHAIDSLQLHALLARGLWAQDARTTRRTTANVQITDL